MANLFTSKIAQPTFCCDNTIPYPRPIRTDHDEIFNPFIKVASDITPKDPFSTARPSNFEPSADQTPYVIHFVKQVNYGPVEFERSFAPATASHSSSPILY